MEVAFPFCQPCGDNPWIHCEFGRPPLRGSATPTHSFHFNHASRQTRDSWTSHISIQSPVHRTPVPHPGPCQASSLPFKMACGSGCCSPPETAPTLTAEATPPRDTTAAISDVDEQTVAAEPDNCASGCCISDADDDSKAQSDCDDGCCSSSSPPVAVPAPPCCQGKSSPCCDTSCIDRVALRDCQSNSCAGTSDQGTYCLVN